MIIRVLRDVAVLLLVGRTMPFSIGAMVRKLTKDIVFATVRDIHLALDLNQPNRNVNNGLIVWIHGGALRSGTKEKVLIIVLVEKGWALASLNYLLSRQARLIRIGGVRAGASPLSVLLTADVCSLKFECA